jgi:hypothetical protein
MSEEQRIEKLNTKIRPKRIRFDHGFCNYCDLLMQDRNACVDCAMDKVKSGTIKYTRLIGDTP